MKILHFAILACAIATTASALDWPQWRGPDRTDLSKETGLLKEWPADGPKQTWIFKNAGQGYSGPAIVGGKLFTLGTRDGKEILLALDAATGKELWTSPLGSILGNGWGDGPRSTPTVDGGKIYALSGPGVLACVNAADGKEVWNSKTIAPATVKSFSVDVTGITTLQLHIKGTRGIGSAHSAWLEPALGR